MCATLGRGFVGDNSHKIASDQNDVPRARFMRRWSLVVQSASETTARKIWEDGTMKYFTVIIMKMNAFNMANWGHPIRALRNKEQEGEAKREVRRKGRPSPKQ